MFTEFIFYDDNDHTTNALPNIYIYIYIYIYNVINRQTVSLYYSSSVSLDPQDASS